jgi:hypothetical protein
MTYWLYVGLYGGTKNYRIDVNMTGLLYVYPGWNIYPQTDDNSVLDQFNITRYIIYNFYTAEKEKLDYISIDRGFVSDISMYCEPASVALSRVWNHININREPAIVVCDYNVINRIRFPNNIQYTGVSPHYIVIAGIRENNSVREFYTLDPWNTMERYWYTEFEMEEIIHISYQFMDVMDAFWLWYLPLNLGLSTQKPCYVGIINES